VGPGRIQHQFLEDREGWIRCRLAETGAGSDPTATPSQRDLVLPKNNHRCHPMQSSFPSTGGANQVRRSEGEDERDESQPYQKDSHRVQHVPLTPFGFPVVRKAANLPRYNLVIDRYWADYAEHDDDYPKHNGGNE